jgi:hypothetical protein
MSDPVNILTYATFVAPLGLRFWDAVGQRMIGDGLEVIASPASDPAQQIAAYPNRSAIYVLRNLPGLYAAEHGAGDEAYWAAPPPSRPFTIMVRDRMQRFLPFRFDVQAPSRGLYGWPCAPTSPPDALAAVPLFSAPARAIPFGMAVIRAQLRTAAGRPASWALLEGRVNGGPPARGLADKAGAVALIFAYPQLPTTGPRPPLTQQTWTIQLSARYRPVTPPPEQPDICDLLDQPEASMWSDAAQTQPLTSATLVYGRELVLRTRKDPTSWLSEVRITPA